MLKHYWKNASQPKKGFAVGLLASLGIILYFYILDMKCESVYSSHIECLGSFLELELAKRIALILPFVGLIIGLIIKKIND